MHHSHHQSHLLVHLSPHFDYRWQNLNLGFLQLQLQE
jgi:hypothetical protein